MMSDEQNELTAGDGVVVVLDYTMGVEDGEIISSSDDDGEMAFIQGREHVFPVIEKAIQGLRVGDEVELVLEPDDAYGEYDEDLLETVPLQMLDGDFDPYVGLDVELFDEDTGEEIEAVVVEVNEDSVVVDMNHPLAGETLYLWLKIVELRPATEEELDHDHVHVDGHGHDHDHDHHHDDDD